MGTITLLLVLSSFPAAGQDSPQDLASEVRQLRQSVDSLRTQVLWLRLQAQKQLVMQAASRLEAIRKQVAQAQSEQAAAAARVRTLQETVANSRPPFTPPNQQLAEVTAQANKLAEAESQLRGQESEAETALRQEQAILDDLNRQLAAVRQ